MLFAASRNDQAPILMCMINIKYLTPWPAISVLVRNLGDNCIQNFHMGRYIGGYKVGNLVLRGHASGDLKCDF